MKISIELCSLPLLVGTVTVVVFAHGQTKEVSPSPASVSNLHQIAMAMIVYAQDYDDHLPPMKDAATAKQALLPYISAGGGKGNVFVHPDTKEPYQPNPSLSYRHYVNPNPEKTQIVAFYQAKSAPEGRHDVLFLPRQGDKQKTDYVRSLSQSEWLKVKKLSKVP